MSGQTCAQLLLITKNESRFIQNRVFKTLMSGSIESKPIGLISWQLEAVLEQSKRGLLLSQGRSAEVVH